MIVDTDVLIWDLRGNELAPFSISVVTSMEVLQGMRNKEELRAFLRRLTRWPTSSPGVNLKQFTA